ncbi:MAG: dihydropteroate synthase [Lachnospiraceae bacterium]|nr:dihydropteroate synthase [Lachnospiraceae bacterium]
MIIGNRSFTKGHTYIMGILNVTPDSFSDGGNFNSLDRALKHTEQMISDGADVIDIGGESTRPGYVRISENEEIERIAPVIEGIVNNFDIPISVDTYKPLVAKEALKKGAHLINDIWGLKGEDFEEVKNGTSHMADLIARENAACCLMVNRNLPPVDPSANGINFDSEQKDIVKEVINDLNESLNIAYKAGIDREKILLDPGVGFGKTYEDNVNVIKKLAEICNAFDLPMLLGTSRKSVIGLTLGTDRSERLEGTLATTAKAIEAGCLFVRVHDVKENARFIKMYETISKGE